MSEPVKRRISEAEAERMADSMVVRRLATDRQYQRAADAEAQSDRESQIEVEVWARITRKYEIGHP